MSATKMLRPLAKPRYAKGQSVKVIGTGWAAKILAFNKEGQLFLALPDGDKLWMHKTQVEVAQ